MSLGGVLMGVWWLAAGGRPADGREGRSPGACTGGQLGKWWISEEKAGIPFRRKLYGLFVGPSIDLLVKAR